MGGCRTSSEPSSPSKSALGIHRLRSRNYTLQLGGVKTARISVTMRTKKAATRGGQRGALELLVGFPVLLCQRIQQTTL
eukprot:COSAG02_NODE_1460_length_12494_cov_126.207422_4_plen_79_part_00